MTFTALKFASKVFHIHQMEKALPKKVFQNLKNVKEGKEKFDPSGADAVASALQEWAIKEGATHFTHWFQPLTGSTAEKHDAFFQWDSTKKNQLIEQLSGRDLFRGEPDASSFPSGGLRTTHQARGYTAWDPAADPFLWEVGGAVTLYIPALFFSWTGFSLDYKTPLLRAEEKLSLAVMRLLKLCKISAAHAFSTLGIEQEYFAIDRELYLQRPDLLLAGRTLFGARSPKGQELEDHYFGPLKGRVAAFMRDFEERALALGIPLKTRHNEVAPAQHEVAPLFEAAPVAVDHNLLLMEIIKECAISHDLASLFHEKPFAFINGSGKHSNWSVATDTGLNLLDPHLAGEGGKLAFLTLLAAVARAVHDHAGLMRASIGSAGNDHRLGGSEAPPTILSIYLGEALERLIDQLIHEKQMAPEVLQAIDLGLAHVPSHEMDASDRNRTSFFAFTGNKFEFRAVGASAHPAFPVTVINAIVAERLNQIVDAIEKELEGGSEELLSKALPILRREFSAAKSVLFLGNAYTKEWEKEAEIRGLPNIRKSFHSFAELLTPKTAQLFQGIFSEEELKSRYEVLVEKYVKTLSIEAHLMVELFRTQILPAALLDQKTKAQAIQTLSSVSALKQPYLLKSLEYLADAIELAIEAIDEVEKIEIESIDFGWEAKGKVFCEILSPKMERARMAVDALERWVDHNLWPLPKYRELLFLV